MTLLKVLLYSRKKIKNNIEKVFIHDNSNTLKNLTSEQNENSSTTIVAENGLVEEKNDFI